MTPPLRILITNSGRRWIGEVGHCALLYEALQAEGHQVLLACRRGSELEEYAKKRGLNAIVLDYSSRFNASDLSDVNALADRVRKERIQLIHAHRGKDHWLAVAVARRHGIPLVRTRHVVTPSRQHMFNRWLYGKMTQGLISVSRAAELSLGELVDLVPIHEVIHSAVDHEKFHPSNRSEDWRREGLKENDAEPLWIGLIGRMQRIKGQKPFLQAAARIAPEVPQARFLMAGRKGNEYRHVFEKAARKHGFGGRLRVEDMLDDLPRVMASLDIGVVASLGSEGMSRVTLEYMASGVPVVATRVGAIPELLEPEGEEPLGIVVPPDDPGAMAEALLELARDPERRRRMAERGREAIERRHDLKAWVGATVDIYRRVLAACG